MKHEYADRDPKSIIVERDKRQRTVIDISDLISSIRQRGILLPLIVTASGVLIAGERRLTTAIHLQHATVPCRIVPDTTTELEAQLIEFEENFRRKDISWQDRARTIQRIHNIGQASDTTWSFDRTAGLIGLEKSQAYVYMDLADAISEGDKSIIEADTLANAKTILARRKSRAQDDAMNSLLEIEREVSSPIQADEGRAVEREPTAGTSKIAQESGPHGGIPKDREPTAPSGSTPATARNSAPTVPQPMVAPQPKPPADPHRIEHADFTEFAAGYDGPRFNLLHVDFPYGVELNGQANQDAYEGEGYESNPDIYWHLCDVLATNFNHLMFPSAHVMFWISMEFYSETIAFFDKRLPQVNLRRTPLIWHKSDNRGILKDPLRGPRNIYEACLFGSVGDRMIVKPVSNVYSAPTNKSSAIHTNEKPQPMLNHFLSMLVDERTRMLDPTAGSGSAIRAAEGLGAEAALGLEFNPEFASRAQAALVSARNLRRLSEKSKQQNARASAGSGGVTGPGDGSTSGGAGD